MISGAQASDIVINQNSIDDKKVSSKIVFTSVNSIWSRIIL